ncbi:HU family DNA-binding protein [Hypericibacter sp.]|uniref:HU family DNA-binding protein n=1 Tax=Hypericibacter sp. TaxID=2705401 RepID=UPI003D6CEF9F
MNRDELAAAVAESLGVTKTAATKILDAIFQSIAKSLKAGEDVRLGDFGTFRLATRAARQGRNPRTGDAIALPSRKEPRFKAGRALKDAVGGNGDTDDPGASLRPGR